MIVSRQITLIPQPTGAKGDSPLSTRIVDNPVQGTAARVRKYVNSGAIAMLAKNTPIAGTLFKTRSYL
ncbi:MAG: hypothetical protein M3R16_09215 [Pseudomonadota bacterium]|nr:hypothetical protein [Pseudomonadota bacterium]